MESSHTIDDVGSGDRVLASKNAKRRLGSTICQMKRDARADGPSASTGNKDNVESFKAFRVSIDDPCWKVLPLALRKYNMSSDWRNYSLFIVHGDCERELGLKEKPLILFKQLDKADRKPMFLLRKRSTPVEWPLEEPLDTSGEMLTSTASSPTHVVDQTRRFGRIAV